MFGYVCYKCKHYFPIEQSWRVYEFVGRILFYLSAQSLLSRFL